LTVHPLNIIRCSAGLQAVQQRFGVRDIGQLAAGQQPAHGIAQRINDCVNLARKAAA
jgi:hypothetical protein